MREYCLSTCKLITSKRVAGVVETYWTHSCPSSVHSLCIDHLDAYQAGGREEEILWWKN